MATAERAVGAGAVDIWIGISCKAGQLTTNRPEEILWRLRVDSVDRFDLIVPEVTAVGQR